MFSSLNITKAKIFIDIISTFNLKPDFTLFIISDKLIKAYSKSIGVSINFLLHSPDFIDIVKNHITYTKLDKHKKTRFVTLSNTSFVFDPQKLVIDDVRGNRYGIRLSDILQDKIIDSNYIAYTIKGILIQNQSPYSYLEALPKDPFQHVILVGDFKSKDIVKLCNISTTISKKCTNDFYIRLLEKLHIDVQNNNPKATYEEFANNPLLWMIKNYPKRLWNWLALSSNPSIIWQIVQDHPNLPWDWDELSANPNITWQIVQDHPDKDWNWSALSENPSITWQIVKDNLDKKWNWNYMSSNPNITWQIVQQNPDKPWNWTGLSENHSITWQDIQANIDLPWDWSTLSANPNITWEIIQQNSNKPWDWYYLSFNPNITWEIIQQNSNEPWNWNNLSSKTN